MSQVLVTESYLDDIADAIREKNGSEDTYTPAEMAGAIEDIHTADEVVLVSKSVTANGTYNPASDSADGYSGVSVNVPNTYTASDNGKVVVNQALTDQTSKSINSNGTHDTTANNSVVVDVPNSYAAADEGKVVKNGSLVSQGSRTITGNGTYDTTLISSLTANIEGGGGGGESVKGFELCFADFGGNSRNAVCLLDNKYFSCFFHDNMSGTYTLNGTSYSFLTGSGSGSNTKTRGATKETANNTDTSENSIISKGSVFSTSHNDNGSYISVGGGWVGYPSGGTIYENMNTGTTNSITMNKAHKTLLIFVGASQKTYAISTIDINGDTYNIKNNGANYDNVYGEYGAIVIDNNSDTTITVTFPNSCWSYLSIVGID